MSFLFGRSKPEPPPTPPAPVIRPIVFSPPPPPPTIKEVEKEKKKLRRGKTTKGTILTSPLGLEEEAETKRPTLLGA